MAEATKNGWANLEPMNLPKMDLRAGFASNSAFMLPAFGGVVPLRYSKGVNSSTLLVTFHGRIDREKALPPAFVSIPRLSSSSTPHHLAISDPSMLLPGKFNMSWYAGHHDFPLQERLPEIIRQTVIEAGTDRLIFLGGSGGGFASLYYSWHFPGSVAVVSCPQTNILRYHRIHVVAYLEGAWPNLRSQEELADKVCVDASKLYSERVPNTVIYLQSSADRWHLQEHMAPFVSAITSVNNSKFILECRFWGVLGHVPKAVPPDTITTWLRATLASPSVEIDDLLSTYHKLASGVANGETTRGGVSPAPRGTFDQCDLDRAELLRSTLMRE